MFLQKKIIQNNINITLFIKSINSNYLLNNYILYIILFNNLKNFYKKQQNFFKKIFNKKFKLKKKIKLNFKKKNSLNLKNLYFLKRNKIKTNYTIFKFKNYIKMQKKKISKKISIIRSPFIFKKSREQFETRNYSFVLKVNCLNLKFFLKFKQLICFFIFQELPGISLKICINK